MYMHPKTYLWIQEQDRERMFQQRALQRAARSGGEQRPGLVRGGIASIVKFVRQADVAIRRAGRDRSDLAADRRFERLTLDRRRPSSGGGGATTGPYHGGHGPAPEQPDLRRPF